MTRVAALAVAALATLVSSPAHATECWSVTGWSTSGAPGMVPPFGAIERPVLVPTSCDVTPPGLRWLHVTLYYSALDPVPADLWVLAPHEDYTRTNHFELLNGLAWQGRYRGIPILWRDQSGPDLAFELQAPAPAAPAVGAEVVLRQRDTQDCVIAGDPAYYQYLLLNAYNVHCDDANPGAVQSWSSYEITDAGTNGAGQQVVHLEHVAEGTCGHVGSWSGWTLLRNDHCALGLSGFDMVLEAVPGGYRIRSEDTGLCYGGNHPMLPNAVDAVSCTDPAAVYEIITLRRSTGGGGGGGTVPPEPEVPAEEM